MKAVIFDLDGTLLNTLDDLANACNHALETENLPTHPVQAYRYFVGNGVAKLLMRILPTDLRDDMLLLTRLRSHFDAYYGAHGQDFTCPYDGILPMLDELQRRGYILAVLSNKPHDFACELVPQYFGDRFAAVYGQRQGYPVKPHPSLVQEVLQKIGVSECDTIYLGDSGVDMETAKNGNLFAIGVLWGYRDRQELLEHGADAILNIPNEIERFLR